MPIANQGKYAAWAGYFMIHPILGIAASYERAVCRQYNPVCPHPVGLFLDRDGPNAIFDRDVCTERLTEFLEALKDLGGHGRLG